MEQRLSVVSLGVRDLAKARAFYEGMGFAKSAGEEGVICFYQLPGLILGLYGMDELAEDAGQPLGDPSKFGGIALAHNVDSESAVDSLLAKADSLGATITRPASKQFWGGYSGYFADLDGHPWEIAYNPYWTITKTGETLLGKS